MARKKARSKSNIPFATLHAKLLTLEATKDGFEGLIANLIGRTTGNRMRLMRSGDQHGVDSVEDAAGHVTLRAMQAKRYGPKTPLDDTALRGEMDEAVEKFSGLDCWVLATTKTVHGKEVQNLSQHAERLGLGFVVF